MIRFKVEWFFWGSIPQLPHTVLTIFDPASTGGSRATTEWRTDIIAICSIKDLRNKAGVKPLVAVGVKGKAILPPD